MLVGYGVLSFSSICQLSSRHNPSPIHKSQWYHWDCFYLFVPTIQGNLVLPLSASVERCQKPLFVPAHDFIYSWKGLAPFSLSHLFLCHTRCLHWVQFYRFKTELAGLPTLLFTHYSFIKSQLLKTKRKLTTVNLPMMRNSKSKAHHKNKTQKPKPTIHLTPNFLHCVCKGCGVFDSNIIAIMRRLASQVVVWSSWMF